ncbi:MAG: HDOD domain-containing protein [Leptospiraceae bacterium]|nr:HDOD domain-containing protein [Leptospiraceae bacterium]
MPNKILVASYPTEKELSTALDNLRSSQTVEFILPGIIDDRLNTISGFLYRLLSHHDSAYLTEMLLVTLREITGNCSRAAAKRIFFKEQKLDINATADYEKGMPIFRDIIQEKWIEFCKTHKDSEYAIKISFAMHPDHVLITIQNNIALLEIEKKRIVHRLQSFHQFSSLSDAFNSIGDTSEGAGLGIFFLLSLLKNSNIPVKNFKILPRAQETVHQIQIPWKPTPVDFHKQFYQRVLAEIDSLPSFPKTITRLLELCDSPDSSLEQIAEMVQRDPSLTAQVLKMVHSAGYISRNRDPGLHDAVKIIGLRGLRDLLMVSGARQALVDHYRLKEIEAIWDRSNLISCFARRLAQPKSARLAEQATIAGLLSVLGRIVLASLKPADLETVSSLLDNKRVRNEAVLEEIVIGISNAEIGGRVAEKWNLPPFLIDSIRYQFSPLRAPTGTAELVQVVYLANCMEQCLEGRMTWWHIEAEVLKQFDFSSQADWEKRALAWKADCQAE